MKQRSQFILAFVILGISATMAHGQPATEKESFQLEEITVTAQKREENPQTVPISMDVLSGIEMEDAGVNNTYDLTKLAPNVHMKEGYTEHVVVIRGISSFSASTYSPAAFYIDDVNYPLVHMQDIEMLDIERAEILKGPQGTLYGRNSESGVVNIITRQPGNHLEGRVFADYGSYNTIASGFSVSGPLVADKLALGTAFQYRSSDGFIENQSTGDDQAADLEHISGRAQLRWTPAPAWDLSLIADVNDRDDHIGGYRFIDGPKRTKPHHVRKDWSEYYQTESNSQVLRTKFEGDHFNLLSITSAIRFDLERLADTDMWDDPAREIMSVFKIDEELYSQEFRLSSSRGERFQWLVGFYGFIEETRFDFMKEIVFANKKDMHPVTDIDVSGLAVFGQATYTLFDRLNLTAGLRLDHQEMKGHLEDSVRATTCHKKLDYDEVLPKFSASYDLSKKIMTYASVSQGYLTGGYNWAMKPVQETFTYDPEYTLNYEAGIKSAWLDGKLTANLALFYIDIDDKQVTEFDAATATKTIRNAARAHSQGAELQVMARLTQGLDLFAGGGYTRAEFDEFSATVSSGGGTTVEKEYEGNDLPYAPRFTYNIGIQYRSAGGIFCRADILGTDSFYGDVENLTQQSSYETVNVRLGYEADRWDAYLWARNVFDEEYLTYVSPYGKNTIGLDGAPRTFGVQVNYHF